MPASMLLYGDETRVKKHVDKILAGEIMVLRNIKEYTSLGKLKIKAFSMTDWKRRFRNLANLISGTLLLLPMGLCSTGYEEEGCNAV